MQRIQIVCKSSIPFNITIIVINVIIITFGVVLKQLLRTCRACSVRVMFNLNK